MTLLGDLARRLLLVTARTRHPHWLCGYCAGRRAMPDADHPCCDDPRRTP